MIKLVQILFLILIVSACTSKEKKSKQQSMLHLQIGTSHLSKGNYPSALNELLKAEKLDQTNPVIYNNLGLAYLVRDKFDLAEKNIRRAVDINPNYTEARNNLGRVLIHRKQYRLAALELKVAIRDLTYPYPDRLYSNLGLSYFKMEKYDLAKKYFKKSLRMNRKSCLTFNYYGRSLFELKDFDRAAPSFDRAITLCKKIRFEEPGYYSALSYLKLGKKEQAVAKFQELIKEHPESHYSKKASKHLSTIERLKR